MKNILLIVLLILFKVSIAQNLKGIVLNTDYKGNITPINGAVVRWFNENNIVNSDSNGVFEIPFSTNTKYLIVSYIGFKTDTIFIAEKKFIKVLLITKNNLKEVNITIERKSAEVSFIDPWKTTIMNEKELFKAACCNLSESFETNPSVDVNLTDAITGTKQIQMLGLASQYSLLTQEMMPGARGLAVNYGNTYTPGSWINSIQVTKGIGSVVNGFESIAGQINTELHKPDVKEKVYFNAYASEGGRYESNLIIANKIKNSFSHSLSLHGSILNARMDNNNDGFLDNPIGNQLNAAYRFKFDKNNGIVFQGGLRTLIDDKTSGELNYDSDDFQLQVQLYGTKIKTERNEGWLKIGYIFPKKIYKNISLQTSLTNQKINSFFGNNRYNGSQNSLYANLIYQTIIGTSNHRVRSGLSYVYDDYKENLYNFQSYSFNRIEVVTGAFFEYTFSYLNKFTLVAGQRLDYNNLYGFIFTPRLHSRYVINKKLVLRASGGRGQRTANILAENTGVLVSSRKLIFNENLQNNAYGLNPEVAWNYGLSLTKDFKLNYRKGSWTVDYYFTNFQNQIVVDRDINVNQVRFYNLNGKSFSNSFQIQLDYEIIKRLDIRLAYRFYDVQTHFDSLGLQQVPLIAAHRSFINFAYSTKNKWVFDLTWQWIGEKRLPNTDANPSDKKLEKYSNSFMLVNAQLSKSLLNKKLDLYLGIENIFDFKVNNPIIDAQNPFGSYFDASMVWGPVFGRMIYSGVRFKF